jgi:predicted amidohydrolase
MDKIAVAQTTSSGNWRENIEKAKQYIKKATEEEAVMIIFPEYFMNYYPDAEHNYTKKAQSLHGEFVQAMKMLAKEFKMWIIFGMNEQTVDETKNYNTMVILNDLGELVSDYKKTHLFNAYKWKESMNTLKGDCLFTPIKTPAGVIGLGICYDLRFPELARYEALSGTQVMLYPAAWVKGKGKFMQWETLLRARAIENEMYVLGCCHYSKEHYMGRSTGFAPGVVSLKRLLNQSNLKSWSSKMIKKSLEAYFFTLKNKIVFCKKQFQNMSVFCFVSTEIV